MTCAEAVGVKKELGQSSVLEMGIPLNYFAFQTLREAMRQMDARQKERSENRG